ncbi:MAG: radical SAM protein [Eubacteriales bacterium]|nr:radical SAM protein [Eubacteriales bacterium]
MEVCKLCPRRCGIDRSTARGFCNSPAVPVVARAALHFWEEPCISGDRGSGTVFFSGCTLRCVYCQNREISRGKAGKQITVERLEEIFFELKDKGAHNINLVTPDHFAVPIVQAVRRARNRGLDLPIVMNTGGYVSDETYDLLKQAADIWLTDFKYSDSALSAKYSGAPDYPEVAAHALERMVEDTGSPVYDADGMMQKGVIVRILLLPGQVEDAENTVRQIWDKYGDRVVLSLMDQYTPPSGGLEGFPELERTVTDEEYDALCDLALDLGIEEAYVQEGGTQSESFIPPFDLEGV